MKVVQFSMTPLAGAPIRIANAVNSHTSVDVRHVDLKRWKFFDHDHVHTDNPELTLELCEKADIIHFYNYVHIDSKEFHPVNFKDLQKKGKAFIWQFESTPFLVSKLSGLKINDIINSDIPKIVIAQYPERFLNDAMVVPNIIPEYSPYYMPRTENIIIDVLYTPTKTISAWESRWDTKGMPETVKILNKINKNSSYISKTLINKPLQEIMKSKQQSRIIIDELVTGSYHLSGLEGLSCGKPTLAYLDNRTDYVLREISGSNTSPFVNVRLENSYDTIRYLLDDKSLCDQIGIDSRNWIEKYWNEQILSSKYEEIYNKLLINPTAIKRQNSLKLDSRNQKFFSVELPDIIYNSRKINYYLTTNLINKIHRSLKLGIKKLANKIKLLINH